jgi:hypothetical protein
MEKVIKGLLGTVYKMSETEIAEVLKTSENGIDEDKILTFILDKDKTRIASLNAKDSPKWKEAVGLATKEVWGKVEKALKDQFGVDSDLKGEELITLISEKAKEGTGGAAGDITDEAVKKHPLYIAAEKQYKKDLAAKEKEKADALAEKETEFTQQQLFAKAKESAIAQFKTLGEAILPADAAKAQLLIDRLLVDELKGYKYQADDKGDLIVLDKEGNRVEDEHGHAVNFKDLVEKVARNNFEFKASQERRSPANDKRPGQGNSDAKKYTGKAPTTKEEYLGILTGDFTTEQKLEVKREFGEKFAK